MNGTYFHALRCLANQGSLRNVKWHLACIRWFSVDYLKKGSVYVHWPYCAKKCTYCNFNKFVSSNIDHERMKKCLITAMNHLLDESYIENVTSLFFGGGTPSLALPSTVEAIISSLRDRLAPDAEVTLEANPTSATGHALEAFRRAGVNRLSLGVQALCDAELRWLGRDHTAADAEACLRRAAALFPGRLSADLLIGRPGQTAGQLRAELARLAALSPHHVALYQLTAPRGTPLRRQLERGEARLPPADAQAELYRLAVAELAAAGLHRYEVANFARPGRACRHNDAVWRGRQYVGVGPGAHGRLVMRRDCVRREFVQTPAPERWMRGVEAGTGGTGLVRLQTASQVRAELLCTALRTRHGLTRDDWLSAGGGRRRWQHLRTHRELHRLAELLEVSDDRLAATDRGLDMLNALLPDLLNVLDSYKEERDEVGEASTSSAS